MRKKTSATVSAGSWQDALGSKELIFEFFFLGLRKRRGVSESTFKALFGVSFDQVYPDLLTVFCDEGLMTREGDLLAISSKGLPLSDSIAENFTEPIEGITCCERACLVSERK
jgi:coproporphyrinogen III oxidase-like Fe-S oxidoreductase